MTFGALSPNFFAKLLPITQAIIGFGLLILVHECGHFFFCKIFGVKTPTFSIGMGPTVYERKIGDTNFKISALPIGGYVEMQGEYTAKGEERSDNSRSFTHKPYWQKLLIMLGGIMFNLLFAYIAYTALFWRGMPTSKLTKVVVNEVVGKSAAYKSGMKAKDVIIGIDDVTFDEKTDYTIYTFLKEIAGKPGKEFTLQVKRGSKTITKTITLTKAEKGQGRRGRLGIAFNPEHTQVQTKPLPLWRACIRGAQFSWAQITGIGHSIKSMIQNRTMKGAGGPVAILSYGFKTAKAGLIPLLLFLAFISINLAIINLFPFGIVDGGRIVMVTIEAIIRRNVPEFVQIIVNAGSAIILLALMLFLTYRDIISIWLKK